MPVPKCPGRLKRAIKLTDRHESSDKRQTSSFLTKEVPCDTELTAHGEYWWCMTLNGGCGRMWVADAVAA